MALSLSSGGFGYVGALNPIIITFEQKSMTGQIEGSRIEGEHGLGAAGACWQLFRALPFPILAVPTHLSSQSHSFAHV
jgi:hypothetical protein